MGDPCVELVLSRLNSDENNAVSDEELQALLAAAVRRYAARTAEDRLEAFPASAGVTATEVMLVATGILRAVDVQLFEFGIWQTFSGARSGWRHDVER